MLLSSKSELEGISHGACTKRNNVTSASFGGVVVRRRIPRQQQPESARWMEARTSGSASSMSSLMSSVSSSLSVGLLPRTLCSAFVSARRFLLAIVLHNVANHD